MAKSILSTGQLVIKARPDEDDVVVRQKRGNAAPVESPMLTRENIEVVLERIRPFMRADGGDIELIDVGEHSAGVRLTGMCAGCPSAYMTLYVGVEAAIREAIPEFETLRLA